MKKLCQKVKNNDQRNTARLVSSVQGPDVGHDFGFIY